MNSTVYKVVFLNELFFVQERNFDTLTAATGYYTQLPNSWKAILKVEVVGTITDVTPS